MNINYSVGVDKRTGSAPKFHAAGVSTGPGRCWAELEMIPRQAGRGHFQAVKRQITIQTAWLLTAGLWLSACGGGGSSEDAALTHGLTEDQAKAVLVKIGERQITVGEFADRLAAESPYIRPRYNNPENRRDYLNNMIDFELLVLEAKRLGLDSAPIVREAREKKMVEVMIRERIHGEIQASAISDAEIQAEYEAHPETYHQPEQRRAEHILVADAARAAHLIARLNRAEDKDTAFQELTTRFSQDDLTRARFGDLRFFSRTPEPSPAAADTSPIPLAVRDAAFAIEDLGDVYPEPVRSAAGFHVVRLRAIRPALQRSLEEARRVIQSKLVRLRREAAVDALVEDIKSQTDVTTHLEHLDALKLEAPEGDAPSAGRNE